MLGELFKIESAIWYISREEISYLNKVQAYQVEDEGVREAYYIANGRNMRAMIQYDINIREIAGRLGHPLGAVARFLAEAGLPPLLPAGGD